MKYFFQTIFFTIICCIPALIHSQDQGVNVERCKVLDQSSPIYNIWVDPDNIKWVANEEGLTKVLSLTVVEKVNIPAGTTSLLQIRGGNAQIEWNTAEMQSLLGNATITCGSYDLKSKTVWIGTKESGAYQISLSPLRIAQHLSTDNRKLTSNQINDIYIHPNGTHYIATNDGMLTGNGDKWTLQERYLNFIGVDAYGDNLWILGDDFLWQVDSKGKWHPIAIDLKNVEGQIRDIAVDDEGRVWIASNMMTGYDVGAEKYQRFGPGQYFTSQFANCLEVDQDGSIWTGTKDKGLYLIQWESSLILTISEDSPMDCHSTGPTASLSVKVAGGTEPYSFKWSNQQSTQKISQLGPGDYSITVTDATGLSKTTTYRIPDPQVSATVELVKPSTGNPAGDGSATVKANGGAGQYTYAWDNKETAQTAIKLTGGTHAVTVTDKAGCTAVATVNVTESLAALTTKISIVKNNLCAGSREGELMVETSGGKTPYTYSWSEQKGIEPALRSLPPGTYAVTVTDATGATATSSVVLELPSAIHISSEVTQAATTNAANGQASVKAIGGKSPYTFKWDNGETGAVNKSLTSGEHTITVTDANGCSSVATVVVRENITAMSVAIRQTNTLKCNEAKNATLFAEVSGGKGPYTYTWNSGSQTSTADQLGAGTYEVVVKDYLGSEAKATFTVTQPTALSISAQQDGVASTNRNDGRAVLKAFGGTGAYEIQWDNGESDGKAVALSTGRHTVTVTDGNGCSSVTEVMINENIIALNVSLEQTAEIKCAGEESAGVTSKVTGGKEPYSFKWNTEATEAGISKVKAGLITVTVTDAMGHTATSAISINSPDPLTVKVTAESAATANGENGRAIITVSGGKEKYSYAWDNGEKSARAEKLKAGLHTVTVTDNNGCTAVGEITISENIQPVLVVIKQSSTLLCADDKAGSLFADITGGKSPYTYLWIGNGQQWTTPTIENLSAGIYSLELTDAAGTKTQLDFELKAPEKLVVTTSNIIPASTGNMDGKVTLKVTGGKAPYSYAGKTWATNASSMEITNLGPGAQTFLISDAYGCTAEVKADIRENIQPLALIVTETDKIYCEGKKGTLEAVITGGKPPYTYIWNTGASGKTISDVSPGKYLLTVTDATAQTAFIEYVIASPEPMVANITNLRSATNDRIADGKGAIEVKGGKEPYTYRWGSGETSSQATKLALGSGTVVVTDANGCTVTADYIIKEKVLPELTTERLASGEPLRMEKIQFDADSINLKSEALPSLDELYEFLYDHPTTIIEVSGHTNGLPADDYCDRISSERAQSVANYLIGKGIESRRVISKGYGKRKPVATNQTPEGRKRNQRVEIRLIKIEE